MLDSTLKAQFTITSPECAPEFPFQSRKALDLVTDIRQLTGKHRLHFRTGVRLLTQRKKLFYLREGEPQFLGMAYKFEIVDLILVKKAISTLCPIRTFNQAQLLIETNRIYADAGQRCRLSDVNRMRHTLKRINPGAKSRVK